MKPKNSTPRLRRAKPKSRARDPEAREDQRCLELVRRCLRLATQLPGTDRTDDLRAATEQMLLASMVSLTAATAAVEWRKRLLKDPRLLATVLNALTRLHAEVGKSRTTSGEPREILTLEGNNQLTKKLNLM